MRDIDAKLKELYMFLREYITDYNYPPSVREIASELNIKSTATVYMYLQKLEGKGLIVKSPDKKRAFTLTDKNFLKPTEKSDFQVAPIIGAITAGAPILAVEDFDGYIPLPPEFNNDNGDLFILRVKGESMILAGIFDGDKIIVRKQDTADNGDIIVALVDDSATVKRFYKKGRKFILHPENSTMEDMIFDDITVLGLVVGLYRKF